MTLINDVNGAYVVELYPDFTNSEIAEIMNVSKGTIDRLVNRYVETKRTVGETRSMSGARVVSNDVYQRASNIAIIMGGSIPEHISIDESDESNWVDELLEDFADISSFGDDLDEDDNQFNSEINHESNNVGNQVDESNTNFGVDDLNPVYPIIQGSISKLHELGVADIELKVDVNINYDEGLKLTFDDLDTMQTTLLNGVDGFQHKIRVSIKYIGDGELNTTIDRELNQFRANKIISSGLILPQEDYDELLITIQ